MSELCNWLHEQLGKLPLIKFPFYLEQLPENGIYFFYEDNEICKHGGKNPRIVRIGTHKEGNFRRRIKEHFLLDESKMKFNQNNRKPSDRSVFRKNIGRALLNRYNDDYLDMWEIDFTERKNRALFGHNRDIDKERSIESLITAILRKNFYFRYVSTESDIKRMGIQGLESSLIGTVAQCKICKPTKEWLGNYSPKKKIRESGLWLVQHLHAHTINENDRRTILRSIEITKSL